MIVRPQTPRSREVVEIFADVVAKVHDGLTLTFTDYVGEVVESECPAINYVFGNSRDVKASLDELSLTKFGTDMKLPMIALFTPVNEDRSDPDYYSVVKVNVIIACQSCRDWNNEQRRELSFANVLRPIYRKFLEEMRRDGRLDIGYDNTIPHKYSENYSYGKYGALTSTGEEVSEPIDAIDIRELELKITHQTCRMQ